MRCCKWCGLKERYADNIQCVQVEQHAFETPTGVDSVVASYEAMLKDLIAKHSDDVDDLASWAQALTEAAARTQREVTLRLTREMRTRAAKRVTVDVVVRNETKE